MPFCTNCGKEINEETKFCPSCGNAVAENGGVTQNQETQGQSTAYTVPPTEDFSAKLNKLADTEDKTAEFDSTDISDNKVFAILSYISILVLVPILAAPNSKFARFHANQGLVLLIAELAYGVISSVIKGVLKLVFRVLPFWFSAVYTLLSFVIGCLGLVFLVFAVIGIINAANGKAKELPIVGKITLLK